ncbi:hypothetical protein WG902_20585 [Ramlibacter sp. PS3R-8]|uniref:hypothetical protein n=1 Tax=Ramlibacter sp. PS3R-8 TaxID=3133437 RepID=UPI0030AF64AD
MQNTTTLPASLAMNLQKLGIELPIGGMTGASCSMAFSLVSVVANALTLRRWKGKTS